MKRPQWSTPSSTTASVPVENLFDNDNNLEVEELEYSNFVPTHIRKKRFALKDT